MSKATPVSMHDSMRKRKATRVQLSNNVLVHRVPQHFLDARSMTSSTGDRETLEVLNSGCAKTNKTFGVRGGPTEWLCKSSAVLKS